MKLDGFKPSLIGRVKMRMSYSRVETFKQCPYKFKLGYVDGLKFLPEYEPTNALLIGTAFHTGIEQDVETAISEYYANYPVITDKHVEEAIKLEYIINKAREILPIGEYERKIEVFDPMHFIGFMDLLVPVEEGVYDLYDFKYSNNIDRYLESGQLHIYKWFFEKATGESIRNMYFVFGPKVSIRLKKTESLEEFRIRLRNELGSKDIQVREITYNEEKVKEYLEDAQIIPTITKFPKNPSKLCDWCDYQAYCESDGTDDLDIDYVQTALDKIKNGVDIMQLPKNERRALNSIDRKKIWIYGAPFSGKTRLADSFPDPLMLNTDGNVRFVTAPYIAIKDIVTTEGRVTKRKFAWEVFKETIAELEKKDNDFKTIVVDLLEDTYEYCRLYMYDKLGITHESDDSYRAWDKVRVEFRSTISKLMNLDYDNIILISHEDTTKDLTKKSGDKITSIKPNLNDKIALKLAGMVDIVARVINDDGVSLVSFKTNEFVFGGGRLKLDGTKDIECTYDALNAVYLNANGNKSKKPVEKPVEATKTEEQATEPLTPEKPVEDEETPSDKPVEKATAEPVGETPETPRRRRRKTTEA